MDYIKSLIDITPTASAIELVRYGVEVLRRRGLSAEAAALLQDELDDLRLAQAHRRRPSSDGAADYITAASEAGDTAAAAAASQEAMDA